MVCAGEKKWQELKRSKNEQNARAPRRHFSSAVALRDVSENSSSQETAAPSPAPQPSTPAITSAATLLKQRRGAQSPALDVFIAAPQRYKSSAAALLRKFRPYTSKFVRNVEEKPKYWPKITLEYKRDTKRKRKRRRASFGNH